MKLPNSGIGDRIYSVITMFVRMMVSIVALPMLARGLGPDQFGLFSTVITYAVVVSLLTDFGYSVKTLRDIAAAPQSGGEILTDTLAAKGLMTFIATVIGVIAIALLPTSLSVKATCILVASGVLIVSYGDLALVALRAVRRYSTEMWIVTSTLAAYLILLAPAMIFHFGVLTVGIIFFATRALYMVLAIAKARALFPSFRLRPPNPRKTFASMRGSLFWAVDSGLGFVSAQADALVVVNVLGLNAAGIYQSAARFVQAAMTMVQVLTNIHIPKLAAGGGGKSRPLLMVLEFAAAGLGLGIFFAIGGPFITRWLLGPQYAAADRLWTGFAVFLFTRYVASAFGSALSARSRPGLRIFAQLVGLAVLAIGFLVFLPRYGIIAAPWIMAAGTTVTTVIYAIAFFRILPTWSQPAEATLPVPE